MSRFKKFNFIVKKDSNGDYLILKKEYIFNMIPMWREIKYYEDNRVGIFKFDNIIKAEEFISEICN